MGKRNVNKNKPVNPQFNPRNDPGRFDFMGKAPIFAGLSLLAFVLSVAIITTKGFNYGIDFAGGTEVQVKFTSPVTGDSIRAMGNSLGLNKIALQTFGDKNEFVLRFESAKGATDQETQEKQNALNEVVTSKFKEQFASQGVEIRRVDSVGPQIGAELKRNGMLAAFYSLFLILIYVGLRFDYKFAPGAVLCLFHDAVITMGVFAFLQIEVNVQIMAAVLTIIGYSLNDTIVNFDRIRENIAAFRDKNLTFVMNRSINEILSRTILTSTTTLMAVAALYFLADGVIRDLAFTLGIGVLVGTYSSVYVAAPLTLLFDKMAKS